MTDLNEYECELLDAVLEAFGIPDSLTRLQLLELFDQDEASAFAMVQILTREGLIAEAGKHGDYELPEKLVLKPKRGEAAPRRWLCKALPVRAAKTRGSWRDAV